jgi:hypothetical protein
MARYNMKAAVDVGFALLDEKYGRRWVDRIHLGSLQLSHCTKCVVGQLFGHFTRAAANAFNGYARLSSYGFCIPTCLIDCPETPFYAALTAMWKRRILERRLELELELETIPNEEVYVEA